LPLWNASPRLDDGEDLKMEWFVRNFIRASLVWLGLGVLIGVSMSFWPAAIMYRAAHMHANLLGFVSMMIFGVAYHIIPRFTGNPLHSRLLAGVHLWVANSGLALLVAGFLVRGTWYSTGTLLVGVGGAVSATGAFFFIYNLWRTLETSPRPTITAIAREHPAVPGRATSG
jgi:cbb3-type cytochrome oxidase subunit 1